MTTPPDKNGEGIYVASRVSRAEMWRDLRDNAGTKINASWIDEAGEGETADFGELWTRLCSEIGRSTGLVFWADVNDAPWKGALVEAGVALALGKPVGVVLLGELEGRTMRPVGSWLHHPLVKVTRYLDEAIEHAQSGAPSFGPIDGNPQNTSLENWFPLSAEELERLRKGVKCQYAEDVGMPEHRCAMKCQYAPSAIERVRREQAGNPISPKQAAEALSGMALMAQLGPTRLDAMVDRFLSWKLPKSVRPDECVLDQNYPHRVGTNLLTADEARQMLEHVLGFTPSHVAPTTAEGIIEERLEHWRQVCDRDFKANAPSDHNIGRRAECAVILERLRAFTPSSIGERERAALHACEGLDTSDLAGNAKGWLAGLVQDAHRVEGDLNSALRARCPGNGDGDDCIVECQLYEASEQRDPCPPGCCAMADEKDVRALMEAIERDDDGEAPLSATGPLKLDTDRQVFFYEQDHYYLSNFSAFKVSFAGITFDTSEHAYHWNRFPHGSPERTIIRESESAHAAFRFAQENKARQLPNWDAIKVQAMREILRCKARQHEYVRRKLLQTGDRELVENSWRDPYWGWGPNRDGQNMLGKLWMEIRAELRATTDGTVKP